MAPHSVRSRHVTNVVQSRAVTRDNDKSRANEPNILSSAKRHSPHGASAVSRAQRAPATRRPVSQTSSSAAGIRFKVRAPADPSSRGDYLRHYSSMVEDWKDYLSCEISAELRSAEEFFSQYKSGRSSGRTQGYTVLRKKDGVYLPISGSLDRWNRAYDATTKSMVKLDWWASESATNGAWKVSGISSRSVASELVVHTQYVYPDPSQLRDMAVAPRSPIDTRMHEGPPGTGKTRAIIDLANAKDALVLCTSRRTADAIRGSITRRGTRVFTIDGYLKEQRPFVASLLIVDEALLSHMGAILVAAARSRCKVLDMFGDSLQIPWIPRCGAPRRYEFTMDVSKVTSATVTYRCPHDVTRYLNKRGYPNLTTASSVKKSVKDRPFDPDTLKSYVRRGYTPVCFLQREKREVKGAMTVNEVQGRTFKRVVLFRIDPTPSRVHLAIEQVRVAVSRHTHEMRYLANGVLDEVHRCSRG